MAPPETSSSEDENGHPSGAVFHLRKHDSMHGNARELQYNKNTENTEEVSENAYSKCFVILWSK